MALVSVSPHAPCLYPTCFAPAGSARRPRHHQSTFPLAAGLGCKLRQASRSTAVPAEPECSTPIYIGVQSETLAVAAQDCEAEQIGLGRVADGVVSGSTTYAAPVCPPPETASLRYGILGRLHRASLDDLASRLGLEDRRLFGEGVDALALFGGGLLHDDHAHEAGNNEDTVLLQLGVADGGQGLKDALHILAGKVGSVLVDDGLDEVGFRERTFGHWVSLGWGCWLQTVADFVRAVPRNLWSGIRCRRCSCRWVGGEGSRRSCHVSSKPALRRSSSKRLAFRGAWPRTWLLKNNTPVLEASTRRRSLSSIQVPSSSSE